MSIYMYIYTCIYIYIYTRTCQLRPPLGLFKMALMDKWS